MDDAKTISGLSLEALERRLGVRRQAQLDAASNQPSSDAHEPAAIERDIERAISAARTRVERDRRAAAAPAERAARKAAAAAAAGVGHALAEARVSLRLAEGRFTAQMQAARRRHERAAADLDGFRRAHDLRRPAVYPASALLSAALLFLAAALEAVFSAALFDADVEGGLLAAAAVSGGLGGANVALGFLAGFLGLRYLQHRDFAPRVGGVAAFAVALALALSLNLFAANWRDQIRAQAEAVETSKATIAAQAGLERCLYGILSDPAAASDDAVYSAREARCRAKFGPPPPPPPASGLWPLKLNTPEAVVLLMLAAGVWAFAALKGFSGVDDPYPDYGKLDRATRRAEEDLAALRDEARDAFEETVEDARAEAESARLARAEALEAAESAFDQAAERMEPLDAEDRRLARTGASLVALYRSENARKRATPPPPSFATAEPDLPLEDALAGAGVALSEARTAAAAADRSAVQAMEALALDVDAALQRLEGVPAPREPA